MASDISPLSDEVLAELLDHAWAVRENAHVIGPTRVGCAVLTLEGEIFEGCNVEHRYRCHDIHAEINAITTMVSSGARRIRAVAIAAERERFTPCGGCMDWIMQFAAEHCHVIAQSVPGGPECKNRATTACQASLLSGARLSPLRNAGKPCSTHDTGISRSAGNRVGIVWLARSSLIPKRMTRCRNCGIPYFSHRMI